MPDDPPESPTRAMHRRRVNEARQLVQTLGWEMAQTTDRDERRRRLEPVFERAARRVYRRIDAYNTWLFSLPPLMRR